MAGMRENDGEVGALGVGKKPDALRLTPICCSPTLPLLPLFRDNGPPSPNPLLSGVASSAFKRSALPIRIFPPRPRIWRAGLLPVVTER